MAVAATAAVPIPAFLIKSRLFIEPASFFSVWLILSFFAMHVALRLRPPLIQLGCMKFLIGSLSSLTLLTLSRLIDIDLYTVQVKMKDLGETGGTVYGCWRRNIILSIGFINLTILTAF